MGSIKLSKEHGVNPMITICFFCGKEKNEIALLGKLPKDAKAPRHGVINYEPCDECRDFMSKGVMISIVRDNSPQDNPDRTGQIFVVREEAAMQMFPTLDVKKQRFCFLEESVARRIFPEEMWDQNIDNRDGGE